MLQGAIFRPLLTAETRLLLWQSPSCLLQSRRASSPEGTLTPERCVRLANSKAGIKPTAPLSAFDKKNLIEFLLDFLHYLYNYYIVCALFSHAYHVTHHVM